MALLPIAGAIGRFRSNEERVDKFVNGADNEAYSTSGGEEVPTIQKWYKDNSDRFNGYLQTQGLPGDAIARFSRTTSGEGLAGLAPLGTVVDTPRGKSYRVTGADTTALREALKVNENSVLQIDWIFKRETDTSNPLTDAVRAGVRYLNNAKQIIGTFTFDTYPLAADGTTQVQRVFAAAAAPGVDAVWPEGTKYLKPFRQTFGSNGVTDTDLMGWLDVSTLYKKSLTTKATPVTVLDRLLDSAAVTPKSLDERLAKDFGTPVTDEEFAVVLVYAADGTPLVAVRYDGSFYNRASRIVTDGYWEFAYTDASDTVLYGKPWGRSYMLFGPFYPDREYVHDAVGRISAGDAYVITDTRQVRLTFGVVGSTVLAIDVRGNDAVYKMDTGGVLSTIREDLLALTSLAPAVTKVRMRILMGQSLSNGGAAIPAITVTPPLPGRVVMYNGGVRVLGTSQDSSYPTTPVPDLNLLSWVDAVERTDGNAGESPACGMGARLAATYPATDAILLAACGVGGQGYAAIGPGTVPDANFRRAVIRGWIMCQLLGLLFEVSVHVDHGETDRAVASGTYKGWAVAWQAHYTAMVQSIVPGHGEVKLYISQLANWTAYALSASTVPDDQAAAARENPGKIYLTGSRYPFATGSDGIHLTPAASKALGEQHADAELRVAAGQPSCFQALTAVRTGNEIIVSGDVPVGPIVRDTATVTDPGPELAAAVPPIAGNKYGFRYVQTGGTPVTVNDVVVDGGTQIKVILSGDPGAVATQALRIAMDGVAGNHGGPTSGPRACFRDSGGNWLTARILPVT